MSFPIARPLCCIVAFLLFLTPEAPAQDVPPPTPPPPEAAAESDEPVKERRRRRGRAKIPRALFGAETPPSPGAADTLLGGTVPEIWSLEPAAPALMDDELPTLLQRDTPVPPVPGKVIRYADRVMRRYDADGDGLLQEEEWKAMPGAPQAIDLNGDRVITLEELVRFLALYGRDRTIHRPVPPPSFDRPRAVSSQFQLFKPVSPPPAAPPPVPSPETDDAAADAHDLSTDLTAEAIAAAETVADEDAAADSDAEIAAGRQVPAERKYYTPPEALRGVPTWFLLRDRDGDGQVSLLEFAPTLSAKALALFGTLDKNGDGFITPDEVRVETPAKK